MQFNLLLSSVLLATVGFGCKSRTFGENKSFLGGGNKTATVRVKKAMSANGEFALGTNEDIEKKNRGALGLLTAGVWYCADYSIKRARSRFEEVDFPILCNTSKKEFMDHVPNIERIADTISRIECKNGQSKHQLDCQILERIPVAPMFAIKPDFQTKVTLTGGFNSNRVFMGQPSSIEWKEWSAEPDITFSDNLFCERYVKNDKGEIVAIDNIIDKGLGGSQTARCFGSREALIKNLDLKLVKSLANKVTVNGVEEIVFGNWMFVSMTSNEIAIVPLQSREEDLR